MGETRAHARTHACTYYGAVACTCAPCSCSGAGRLQLFEGKGEWKDLILGLFCTALMRAQSGPWLMSCPYKTFGKASIWSHLIHSQSARCYKLCCCVHVCVSSILKGLFEQDKRAVNCDAPGAVCCMYMQGRQARSASMRHASVACVLSGEFQLDVRGVVCVPQQGCQLDVHAVAF